MSYSRPLGASAESQALTNSKLFQYAYADTVRALVDAGRQAYDQADRERKIRAAATQLQKAATEQAAALHGLDVEVTAKFGAAKGASQVGIDPEELGKCLKGGDTKVCVKEAAKVAATKGCNAVAAAYTAGATLAVSGPICSKLGAIAATVVAEPLTNIINGMGKALGIGNSGPRCTPTWEGYFARYCANVQAAATLLTKGVFGYYDQTRTILGLDGNKPLGKLAFEIEPAFVGHFVRSSSTADFDLSSATPAIAAKLLDRNMPSLFAPAQPDWHTREVPNPSGFDVTSNACQYYMNALMDRVRFNQGYPCDWQFEKALALSKGRCKDNSCLLDISLPYMHDAQEALHQKAVKARNEIAASWITGYTATLSELNMWMLTELADQTERQIKEALAQLQSVPFLPKPQALVSLGPVRAARLPPPSLAKPKSKKTSSPAVPILIFVGVAGVGMILFRKKIKAWKHKSKR